jgi:hypothetical protein
MRYLVLNLFLLITLTGCGADWFPAPKILPVSITTTTLPAATVGTAYSQTLAASGGILPYTWTTASGTPPAGLTISNAGVISGTPTTGGDSLFTVKVSDSSSPVQTATKALDIKVTQTLAAGATVTLTSGQSVLVPSGTTVTVNGGTPQTVSGDNTTTTTSAGAVVSVPATATGAADNTVVANP